MLKTVNITVLNLVSEEINVTNAALPAANGGLIRNSSPQKIPKSSEFCII
jgi:hypothetical protein